MNSGAYSNPPPRPQSAAPVVTYTLIAITVVFYLLQMAAQLLIGADVPFYYGGKINQFILRGELWRLITPVFLHGSILHIGFNMYALFALGPRLEQVFGRTRFLALYFVGAFGGNVLSFLLTPNPSLGASTAIFGLVAAQGVFVWQNRQFYGDRTRSILLNILYIAGINLLIGLGGGFDNWGHVGGFIAGGLFTWLAGPLLDLQGFYPFFQVRDRREAVQVQLGTVAVVGLFAVLALTRFFIR